MPETGHGAREGGGSPRDPRAGAPVARSGSEVVPVADGLALDLYGAVGGGAALLALAYPAIDVSRTSLLSSALVTAPVRSSTVS